MPKLYALLALFIIITTAVASPYDPAASLSTHHSAQGFNDYCSTCHICDQPTHANPCLLDCPRHFRFQASAQQQQVSDMVVLNRLTDLYGPVSFNHATHANMAEMQGNCGLCHHYTGSDGIIQPCQSCHPDVADRENIDQPSLKGAYHRQCLGCHREWQHENACNYCHMVEMEITEEIESFTGSYAHPKIEVMETYFYDTSYDQGAVVTFHHKDHDSRFGLDCNDCHIRDECGRCHDATRQHVPAEHAPMCRECHQGNKCAFCHDDEQNPPFNHLATAGWELSADHYPLACDDCHTPVETFCCPTTHCGSCHDDWELGEFNHVITGLTLSEDHEEFDCDACHEERNFSTPPSCEMCHDEVISWPEVAPGYLE